MVHRYPMDQDAYFAYNKKFLAPVLEVAEKYGTFLCVENTSAKIRENVISRVLQRK